MRETAWESWQRWIKRVLKEERFNGGERGDWRESWWTATRSPAVEISSRRAVQLELEGQWRGDFENKDFLYNGQTCVSVQMEVGQKHSTL